MRRVLLVGMALALAIAGAGCATALNMQDAALQKPYGGFLMKPDEFFGGGHMGECSAILFWPMWLLDKPLSLAADTITLPYVLWHKRDDWYPPEPSKEPVPTS